MSERQPEYQIPLFPISGWDVGRSDARGAVLLRLLYSSPGDPGPAGALLHSMTPAQARELARELLNEAAALEATG